MSVPLVNTDLSTPLNDFAAGIPMDWGPIEQGKIPIFWGDNQFLDDSNNYSYPSGMIANQTLHLPKVCRFIYSYGEDDDPSESGCDNNSNDCLNGSTPGDPCANGDQYAELIWFGNSAFPGAVGSFNGWKPYGVIFGSTGTAGPSYLTDKAGANLATYFPHGNPGGDDPVTYVNGNPCSAIIVVTAFQPSPTGYIPFTFYSGTLSGFIPSPADKAKWLLPGVFGVPCCKQAGGGSGGGGGGGGGGGSGGPGNPSSTDSAANCFGGVDNGTGDDGGQDEDGNDDGIVYGRECSTPSEGPPDRPGPDDPGSNDPDNPDSPAHKSVWPSIGKQLDTYYSTQSNGHPEYFYQQSYDNDDFMYILVPALQWNHPTLGTIDCLNSFFGTKVLNIFIAQKPYGWKASGGEGGGSGPSTFVWDDPSSDYSIKVAAFIDQLNKSYNRFPLYRTRIYVDMFTALQVQSLCPNSDMPQMMCRTANKLKALCQTTFGFEWGGIITDQTSMEYFQPVIDAFYGNPEYKTNIVSV